MRVPIDGVVVDLCSPSCRTVLLKISVVLMNSMGPASDTGEQFPLLYEQFNQGDDN